MGKILDGGDPQEDGSMNRVGRQRQLTGVLAEVDADDLRRALLNDPDAALGRARAAAFLSGGDGGGAFLTATPAFRRNRMTDERFKQALVLRLGVPLLPAPLPCERCGKTMDVFGGHAWRCSKMRGNGNTRHKAVNDEVFHITREAGLPAHHEAPYDAHFEAKPGKAKKLEHRADVLITGLAGKKVIDTTVRHPVDALGAAHEQRGLAARKGEEDKVSFISSRYVIPTASIIPFAVETYGTLGDKAKDFLRHCAEARAGGDEKMIPLIEHGYRARVAVAVQKGNGVSLDVWRAKCCYKPPVGGGVPGAAGGGG